MNVTHTDMIVYQCNSHVVCPPRTTWQNSMQAAYVTTPKPSNDNIADFLETPFRSSCKYNLVLSISQMCSESYTWRRQASLLALESFFKVFWQGYSFDRFDRKRKVAFLIAKEAIDVSQRTCRSSHSTDLRIMILKRFMFVKSNFLASFCSLPRYVGLS